MRKGRFLLNSHCSVPRAPYNGAQVTDLFAIAYEHNLARFFYSGNGVIAHGTYYGVRSDFKGLALFVFNGNAVVLNGHESRFEMNFHFVKCEEIAQVRAVCKTNAGYRDKVVLHFYYNGFVTFRSRKDRRR